jgi:F1F0 ATPase subunit 2
MQNLIAMKMINSFILMEALVAGLLMGIVYFGGLWLTVQRLREARRPALLALGSLAGRLAMMLLVLYLVTGGQWAGIGIYLLGFFIMRTVLVWRWGPRTSPTAKEGNIHGPQP